LGGNRRASRTYVVLERKVTVKSECHHSGHSASIAGWSSRDEGANFLHVSERDETKLVLAGKAGKGGGTTTMAQPYRGVEIGAP